MPATYAFVGLQETMLLQQPAPTVLFGGLALANAKLGSVHGIAGPLGGMIDAPHGALCARLLPIALSVNWVALAARAPQHPTMERMTSLAKLLTGDRTASAADGVEWLTVLVAELGIPRLSEMGLTSAMIPRLVAAARMTQSRCTISAR